MDSLLNGVTAPSGIAPDWHDATNIPFARAAAMLLYGLVTKATSPLTGRLALLRSPIR